MSADQPLTGTDLIDCARANAPQGLEVSAQQCGFGDDTTAFMTALKDACQSRGITVNELSDLITDQQSVQRAGGVEVAPDTPSDL
ncbi:MAG: hypothetical protein F6J97_19005 [Leptolyngbya sp. SIO4C1]|nr:hypothetical protein [Leptolyngbya sp. SIO4C1]